MRVMNSAFAKLLRQAQNHALPPPSVRSSRERRVTLARLIARAVFPSGGKVIHAHYPNKSWGAVLGLEAQPNEDMIDMEAPHIEVLERYINKREMNPDVRLQLQIMVLEAKIYRTSKAAWEATASAKFPTQATKQAYRSWAKFTFGPGAESSVEPSTWLQHDKAPNTAVVVPVLDTTRVETKFHYPALLKQWWLSGYTTAMLIDAQGRRTRCEFWELARHLRGQEFHEKLAPVRGWALKAERMKMELAVGLLVWDVETLSRLIKKWSAEKRTRTGKAVMSRKPNPASEAPKTAVSRIRDPATKAAKWKRSGSEPAPPSKKPKLQLSKAWSASYLKRDFMMPAS